MLKNTAPSITPSLTKLLKLSIQSGRFPEAWKLSSVVPIPKGNEHESPSNYRPISLLSVTSKLLECYFHQLITDHWSDNHPLANTQWEFQPAKSTVSALLSTTYDRLEEKEAGRDICSMFLDLGYALACRYLLVWQTSCTSTMGHHSYYIDTDMHDSDDEYEEGDEDQTDQDMESVIKSMPQEVCSEDPLAVEADIAKLSDDLITSELKDRLCKLQQSLPKLNRIPGTSIFMFTSSSLDEVSKEIS